MGRGGASRCTAIVPSPHCIYTHRSWRAEDGSVPTGEKQIVRCSQTVRARHVALPLLASLEFGEKLEISGYCRKERV